MRVNIYAEEIAGRFEVVEKEVDGQKFTGIRIFLETPVTVPITDNQGQHCGYQVHKGPFLSKPGDDDSSAVTFWGTGDLREILYGAIEHLDKFYATKQ